MRYFIRIGPSDMLTSYGYPPVGETLALELRQDGSKEVPTTDKESGQPATYGIDHVTSTCPPLQFTARADANRLIARLGIPNASVVDLKSLDSLRMAQALNR